MQPRRDAASGRARVASRRQRFGGSGAAVSQKCRSEGCATGVSTSHWVSGVTRERAAACRMPEFESAHLGPPTEHGRAEAEKVGHLSLGFHGFWLKSSGDGSGEENKCEPGPTCSGGGEKGVRAYWGTICSVLPHTREWRFAARETLVGRASAHSTVKAVCQKAHLVVHSDHERAVDRLLLRGSPSRHGARVDCRAESQLLSRRESALVSR
jgi:hypothetical protein